MLRSPKLVVALTRWYTPIFTVKCPTRSRVHHLRDLPSHVSGLTERDLGELHIHQCQKQNIEPDSPASLCLPIPSVDASMALVSWFLAKEQIQRIPISHILMATLTLPGECHYLDLRRQPCIPSTNVPQHRDRYTNQIFHPSTLDMLPSTHETPI